MEVPPPPAKSPGGNSSQSESALRRWEETRWRLAPVIGEDGFRILFARSLHLTRKTFPWLALPPKPTGQPFADLKASLERETQKHAEEAIRTLFATFIGLLHVLIGEALATRLLESTASGSVRRP